MNVDATTSESDRRDKTNKLDGNAFAALNERQFCVSMICAPNVNGTNGSDCVNVRETHNRIRRDSRDEERWEGGGGHETVGGN